MKLIIEGDEKEIAALILEVSGRQEAAPLENTEKQSAGAAKRALDDICSLLKFKQAQMLSRCQDNAAEPEAGKIARNEE